MIRKHFSSHTIPKDEQLSKEQWLNWLHSNYQKVYVLGYSDVKQGKCEVTARKEDNNLMKILTK